MDSLPFRYQQREYWEFYCPACKAQRRSFYWPSPRVRHYVALGILGLFIAAASQPWLGYRGGMLILPVWAGFEFLYRARARQSLICSRCGFDPYLYKYDVKLARDKVERFWAEKKKKAQAKAAQQTTPQAHSAEEGKEGAGSSVPKAGSSETQE